PDAQPVDDTRSRALRYSRLAAVLAPIVEHPHENTGGNAASGRVAGIDLEQRLALSLLQAGHIDEAGVEEIACRRRDHRQGEALRSTASFVIGQMIRQAVQALPRQPLAEEFALARRRRKTTGGERCVGHVERRVALLQQLVEIDPAAVGAAAKAFVVFGEARLVVTEAQREFAEDLRVGPGLAQWRDRRPVE